MTDQAKAVLDAATEFRLTADMQALTMDGFCRLTHWRGDDACLVGGAATSMAMGSPRLPSDIELMVADDLNAPRILSKVARHVERSLQVVTRNPQGRRKADTGTIFHGVRIEIIDRTRLGSRTSDCLFSATLPDIEGSVRMRLRLNQVPREAMAAISSSQMALRGSKAGVVLDAVFPTATPGQQLCDAIAKLGQQCEPRWSELFDIWFLRNAATRAAVTGTASLKAAAERMGISGETLCSGLKTFSKDSDPELLARSTAELLPLLDAGSWKRLGREGLEQILQVSHLAVERAYTQLLPNYRPSIMSRWIGHWDRRSQDVQA